MATLGDWGERRLTRELIPKYVTGGGSDCGEIGTGAGTILVTTDPVPRPAAEVIGGDPDLYWWGRLLVTINASDLAAGGAEPLAFVAAIEAPSDLSVDALERFLEGIRDAADTEGLLFVGGNLREARAVAAVGTAVGIVRGTPIRRMGAANGDVLVIVGRGGEFWRDALRLRAHESVSKSDSPVFQPKSQSQAMAKLRQHGIVTAAIDCSDGLLPALEELSTASNVRIVLNLETLTAPEGWNQAVDPARGWLGWGDWLVVATVPTGRVLEAAEVCREVGATMTVAGSLLKGRGVGVARGSKEVDAPRLESERFARDSWLSQGIESYVESLLQVPLP